MKLLKKSVFSEHKEIIKVMKIFLEATATENRQEMIKIIRKNDNITISELTEKMGMAYKNVHANIKALEDAGIIITKKKEKTQGRKVFLKLAPSFKELPF